MMKRSKLILLGLFILPWLTLPLLGKETIKRCLPAGIFMSIVVSLESILARKLKWWKVYDKLHPKLQSEFPLICGPFLVGTMWILKITYGKFFTYIGLNLIVDSFFTYIFTGLLQKLKVGRLQKMKKYQLSLLFFVKSLLLYGFQYKKEKVMSK